MDLLAVHPGAVVLALIVWTLATARIVRLVVFDHYPPMVWVRMQWDRWTGGSKWNLLLRCGYCFAPWASLFVGALGCWYFGYSVRDVAEHWWWAVALWLSTAYVAAIVVAYDGDD